MMTGLPFDILEYPRREMKVEKMFVIVVMIVMNPKNDDG